MLNEQALVKFASKYNLSSKQTEVLREVYLRPHETSSQLAPNVGCSPSTLNVHIANILDKCGLKNRRELLNQLKDFVLQNETSDNMRALNILFADDDPIFQDKVINQIARLTGDRARISRFSNGLELIMHLSRAQPSDPEYMFPDIILLDLVMPTMDGFKTLEKIKSDARWSDIPVVVFSSSAEKNSINSSYAQGANSYVIKPVQDLELEKVVKLVLEYWGKIGTSPRRTGA